MAGASIRDSVKRSLRAFRTGSETLTPLAHPKVQSSSNTAKRCIENLLCVKRMNAGMGRRAPVLEFIALTLTPISAIAAPHNHRSRDVLGHCARANLNARTQVPSPSRPPILSICARDPMVSLRGTNPELPLNAPVVDTRHYGPSHYCLPRRPAHTIGLSRLVTAPAPSP